MSVVTRAVGYRDFVVIPFGFTGEGQIPFGLIYAIPLLLPLLSQICFAGVRFDSSFDQTSDPLPGCWHRIHLRRLRLGCLELEQHSSWHPTGRIRSRHWQAQISERSRIAIFNLAAWPQKTLDRSHPFRIYRITDASRWHYPSSAGSESRCLGHARCGGVPGASLSASGQGGGPGLARCLLGR